MYKKKIYNLVKKINQNGNGIDDDYISIDYGSGTYTILHCGRRCSPDMTAKECYKALQAIFCFGTAMYRYDKETNEIEAIEIGGDYED